MQFLTNAAYLPYLFLRLPSKDKPIVYRDDVDKVRTMTTCPSPMEAEVDIMMLLGVKDADYC